MVAREGDKAQVSDGAKGYADEKGLGQEALLVDGDGHVLDHAVDKAEGQEPDDELLRSTTPSQRSDRPVR